MQNSINSTISSVKAHRGIICNSPYLEPTCHFSIKNFGMPESQHEGRRPAGYMPASDINQLELHAYEIVPLDLVNTLRQRVKKWREAGYQNTTSVTKELFNNWFGLGREAGVSKPYFAQQEAVETIVYLAETPRSGWDDLTWPEQELTGGKGLDEPNDGQLLRHAIKMATGTGKTLVMGMLIVWQVLNKVASPNSTKYSKNILVIAPNLTVKRRLEGSNGINPKNKNSVYGYEGGWHIVPSVHEKNFSPKVKILNWQKLSAKNKRGNNASKVVDLGEESEKVFSSRLLSGLGGGKIFVINDEGHHAWRVPKNILEKRNRKKTLKREEQEIEDARIWVQALDKIQKDRGLTACIDMSATPMYPSSAAGDLAWRLFPWTISDFPLADAIESGMTKVPYRPIADDLQNDEPRYLDLWERIKALSPGRHKKNVAPDAWLNEIDGALKQLAGKWAETFRTWKGAKRETPPVLIAVCDNTKMSELLYEYIAEKEGAHPKLKNTDQEPYRTLRYDSAIKNERDAESKDSFTDLAEMINTVGKKGEPGEQVRCVISVAMLTEGWDAKNVTQIFGLRPFQSPLLCEQVLGRGLRRSNYDDLSTVEMVEIYGVPIMLLPQFEGNDGAPRSIKPQTVVRALNERQSFRIEFPRVQFLLPDDLDFPKFDINMVEPILIGKEEPSETWIATGIGAPHEVSTRDEAYKVFSQEKYECSLAHEIANAWEDKMRNNNIGNLDNPELNNAQFNQAGFYRERVFPTVLKAVQETIKTKVTINPGGSKKEIINRRYSTMLRDRILKALQISAGGQPAWWPVLEKPNKIGSTDNYYRSTIKQLVPEIYKSHLSHAICDSKLEVHFVELLESHNCVESWVKNDEKLGFFVPYSHADISHAYYPDFIAKMTSGITLAIEAKGNPDNKDADKRMELRNWCSAITRWGEMGQWEAAEFNSARELNQRLNQYEIKHINLRPV